MKVPIKHRSHNYFTDDWGLLPADFLKVWFVSIKSVNHEAVRAAGGGCGFVSERPIIFFADLWSDASDSSADVILNPAVVL